MDDADRIGCVERGVGGGTPAISDRNRVMQWLVGEARLSGPASDGAGLRSLWAFTAPLFKSLSLV